MPKPFRKLLILVAVGALAPLSAEQAAVASEPYCPYERANYAGLPSDSAPPAVALVASKRSASALLP